MTAYPHCVLPARYSREILFGGHFRARLWTNLGIVAFAVAMVTMLGAALPAFGAREDTSSSRADLAAAYTAIRSEMIKDGRHSFAPPAQVERVIAAGNPNLTVSAAPDMASYLNLRAHHVPQGALAVVKSAPTELELLARHNKDGILELDAALGQQPTYHERYHGKGNPGLFLELTAMFAGIGLFFWPLITLNADTEERRRRRRDWEETLAEKKRWRELVPNERFGPEEPEPGFALWLPQKQEVGDDCVLSAKLVDWGGGEWRNIGVGHKPQALETVRVPLSSGLAQATEAWVDFCHRTAFENADRYRLRLEAEAANERARLEADEAARRLAEAAELKRQECEIVINLPDHAELIRSAPLP